MKILYSQIKELVLNLRADPRQVGEILTMAGLMVDSFEEVNYQGKKNYLIGLEVRQNRPDCLSVFGIAREVAAYYGLPLKIPAVSKISFGKNKISIKVKNKEYVKRIVAIEIGKIKNSQSPKWLKEFLSFYDINSVNFLVDLSNYAMILTGQPSHIFDKEKITGNLSWALNKKFEKIITLDKSEIKIDNNALIIEDDKNILALAGIIGGDKARIDINTKSIILEMAIYDNSIILRNSRKLNIKTEASLRLSKKLDPNNLDFALNLLVSLILKYCGGKMVSEIFDYYPKKYKPNPIRFNPELASKIAGVDISVGQAEKILKNLGCKIKKSGKNFLVTPPLNRTDLEIAEDLAEEVVRIFGFYNIPSDELPIFEVVEDITPKSVYLNEKIKDILTANGFDEILSLSLVAKNINSATKYRNLEIVTTQNSINEEFPELRYSIAAGLILQFKNYLKLGIKDIKIFEIGKVFGKENKKYVESNSLGILISSDKKAISEIKETIEKLLRYLGFGEIEYYLAKEKPSTAIPFSVFDIIISEKIIGILYKLNLRELKLQDAGQNVYFAEINLDEICDLLEKIKNIATFEITRKIVTLDANIELNKNEPIYKFLKAVKEKIKEKNLMSIKISDIFPLKDKIRYTVRVSYKELSDQEAKKIHLKVFNLQ